MPGQRGGLRQPHQFGEQLARWPLSGFQASAESRRQRPDRATIPTDGRIPGPTTTLVPRGVAVPLALPGLPKKYGDELRERATRMTVEARKDPAHRAGATRRVADQRGMHPETLRNWVRQAAIDGSVRAGTTSDDTRRLAELEREKRELRRANEILRTASALARLRSSTARSGRTGADGRQRVMATASSSAGWAWCMTGRPCAESVHRCRISLAAAAARGASGSAVPARRACPRRTARCARPPR